MRVLKTTKYFQSFRRRPDRAIIKDEWIKRVVELPEREQIQHDGRIRRWARIDEMDGSYLRVILLPDGETIQCLLRQGIRAVKVKYFEDTDTLYIEFRESDIAESRDLDENTVLDVDATRNVCAITFEHA